MIHDPFLAELGIYREVVLHARLDAATTGLDATHGLNALAGI